MSYCRKEGKDVIMMVTKEEHQIPSKVRLTEMEQPSGLIRRDGSINWSCPCLGGMATGPCGIEFREAFSCFHSSNAEPKGSDCLEKFQTMQECMQQYPRLYPTDSVGGKAFAMDDDENEESEQNALGTNQVTDKYDKKDKV